MKKLCILTGILFLASCGAIGIGSNHKTMVYNNSDDVITVTANSGVYKLEPNDGKQIYSKDDILIQNKNKKCAQVNVEREVNSAAVLLDIVPGILFGIVPIFVDAVTNNLYRMPDAYSYSCAG